MGYEIRLKIGRVCNPSKQAVRGNVILDGECAYREYIKDDQGKMLYSDVIESYFMSYAEIDLCKPGYESNILKLDFKNKDEKNVVYWYEGSIEQYEDPYGDKPKAMNLSEVLDALRLDAKESDYRRFKWAVSLLESMDDDSEELQVLIIGH